MRHVRLYFAAVLALALAVPASRAATLPEVQAMVQARNPDALKAAEALVKTAPKEAGAWIALARARLQARQAQKAVDAAQRATELAPNDAQAFLWLGNAYGNRIGEVGMVSKMTMAPKLRDAFERAVKLDSSLVDARTALIEFYLQAPGAIGGGIDKARAQATAIAKYDRARGFLAQARIARHENKPAQAVKAYEEAYALKPKDPQIRIALIVGYQETKRWADAKAAIQRWIAEQPGSNNAQYQMGRLAAVSGQFLPDGEAALRRYLTMPRGKDDPEIKHARHRLGQILAHAGRKDEARAEYQAALKLDPTFKDAKEALAAL